jgi:hypothetical protein
MNLPTPKTKRSHYQERRAHADGYEIEVLDIGNKWSHINDPRFQDDTKYRIVPDTNGWLPYYATEDSVCPVGHNDRVDTVWSDGDTRANVQASQHKWSGAYEFDFVITHYRPHKERKLIKTVKYFDDGTEEVCE